MACAQEQIMVFFMVFRGQKMKEKAMMVDFFWVFCLLMKYKTWSWIGLLVAVTELLETPAEDGVGGGIMAVIMEADDGDAISEATGVAESEAGLLSASRLVVDEPDRKLLAALRLQFYSILLISFQIKRNLNLPS